MTKTIGGGAPDGIPIVTAIAGADVIPFWRDSNADTRVITWNNFVSGLVTGSGALSGGGTVATGGSTLTVPATGTAALLGTAQTFTATQTFDRIVASSLRAATESIADDAAVEITGLPSRAILLLSTGANANEAAIINYRAESGPHINILAGGAAVEVQAGVSLDGTTGNDNKMTVSVGTGGSVYMENRHGYTVTVRYGVIG